MLSPFLPLFALLSASSPVRAAPARPTEDLAFGPTVIEPTVGTTWTTGTRQWVRWETDNVPDEARSYTLGILLGRLFGGSENLDVEHPLATDIPMMQGNATVQVPAGLDPHDDYIVVLLGTSGDASPVFTVLQSDA